ncbi:MAG: hypothetical protein J3R72DRAFT_435120 [Linnemannia gamsii]|nr:MAG: hypothetical protein J3R72DRAFT_435120 [Linnemannia gamsii]
MMIKEPIDAESGTLPAFESTLVVAFPDVLMAGPKILLSSAHATSQGTSIPAWSHFCTTPVPTNKRSTASATTTAPSASSNRKKRAEENAIRYSAVPAGGIGLLTITIAPPTNEQSSYLCEAIVHQARVSGTKRIVLVAASNFSSKVQDTHIVQLHQEGLLGLAALPKNVSLGDHILSTFLTLLTYIDIPTTALVHPAKKGTNLRETRTIIESLTRALGMAIGGPASAEFSADKAFDYNTSTSEEEASVESMMYL